MTETIKEEELSGTDLNETGAGAPGADTAIEDNTPDEPGREATSEEAAEAKTVASATDNLIHVSRMATVTWLDADDNELATETCNRSFVPIRDHLMSAADTDKKDLDSKLRITLDITDKDGELKTVTDNQGTERSTVLLFDKGTLRDAIEHFSKHVMPPVVAYNELQVTIAKLAELSTLKIAVVTLVFDDAKPVPMVFTSDSINVTDEDRIMAGSTAEDLIEKYKAAMRTAYGIEFPGDSNIILPENASFSTGGLS